MRIEFEKLPFWQGVASQPGQYFTLPFVLEARNNLVQLQLSESDCATVTAEYNKGDFTFRSSPPGTSEWGNHRGEWHVKRLKECVGTLAGKSVLEIGAGTYYMAERVTRELGASKYTVCDPVLKVEHASPNIELVSDYFSADLFAKERFDMILSICNLEHIPDPLAYMADVGKLLAKTSGSFYCVVPDCTRPFLCGDIGVCIHEHINFFTPQTLKGLFARSGLATSWQESELDSLFALGHPSKDVSPLVDMTNELNATLREFKEKMDKNVTEAGRLIEDLTGQGPTGIHGCHVGLNNALFLLGISDNDAIHLFDGDTNKTNLYIPAFGRPILHPSNARYREMKAMIVSALGFFNEIASSLEKEYQYSPDRIRPIFPIGNGA